ncbi:MAG: RNA polymerase sigma factor [Vicinamibacterales bacterium]
MRNDSDDTLLDLALAGNEDAFVVLVERYQTPLLRFARGFVRQASQAEDVVQDAWMGVLRGLERFERRSSFKTWLFRIVANRARTKAVRDARYVGLDIEGDDAATVNADDNFTPSGRLKAPPPEWSMTPERLLQSTQARTLVMQALAELPDTQRMVVTLRDVEGLDSTDVCNILEISETNQRVLLHRGRTKVRAVLAAHLSLQE